jgi:serine/threonine protein phosphatase PrpC
MTDCFWGVFCVLRSTAFLQTDSDFLKIAHSQRLDDGSTAVCAYIHNGTCYVANTGDSRCVLASNGTDLCRSAYCY